MRHIGVPLLGHKFLKGHMITALFILGQFMSQLTTNLLTQSMCCCALTQFIDSCETADLQTQVLSQLSSH